MALSGLPVAADRALAWGLVDEIGPSRAQGPEGARTAAMIDLGSVDAAPHLDPSVIRTVWHRSRTDVGRC